ncbi:hypothetical protein CHS0354_018769, partial [Potamilus streckersoni]
EPLEANRESCATAMLTFSSMSMIAVLLVSSTSLRSSEMPVHVVFAKLESSLLVFLFLLPSVLSSLRVKLSNSHSSMDPLE